MISHEKNVCGKIFLQRDLPKSHIWGVGYCFPLTYIAMDTVILRGAVGSINGYQWVFTSLSWDITPVPCHHNFIWCGYVLNCSNHAIWKGYKGNIMEIYWGYAGDLVEIEWDIQPIEPISLLGCTLIYLNIPCSKIPWCVDPSWETHGIFDSGCLMMYKVGPSILDRL